MLDAVESLAKARTLFDTLVKGSEQTFRESYKECTLIPGCTFDDDTRKVPITAVFLTDFLPKIEKLNKEKVALVARVALDDHTTLGRLTRGYEHAVPKRLREASA